MMRLFLRILAAVVAAVVAAPAAVPQSTHVDREGFPLPDEAVARIGSIRLRHVGTVHGLAYSRDGKRIISIGADDRICVWDADTGKLLRWNQAKLGTRHPLAVRITDAAVDVATNGFLFSFDIDAGRVLHKVAVSDLRYAREGRFSPDGAWFACGASVLSVRDAYAGKQPGSRQFGSYPAIECVAFTPDSKQVAVAHAGKKPIIQLIDVAAGEREPSASLRAAGRCWFLPDGRCMIGDRVWDPQTGKHLATLEYRNLFASVAFSPDGRLVAVPDWSGVALYQTARGQAVRRLLTGPDIAARVTMPLTSTDPARRPLAFSPDGKRLVVGNGEGQISQWDIATGEPLCSTDPFTGTLRVRRFLDGDRLIADAGGLVLYNRKTGSLLHRYPWLGDPLFGHAIKRRGTIDPSKVELSPDGTILAVPRLPGLIALLNARTGATVRILDSGSDYTTAIAFAPDGKRLYTGCEMFPKLRVWEVATGKVLMDVDGQIRIDRSGGERPEEHLVIAPRSRHVARVANARMHVWATNTYELVYRQDFKLPLSRHCTFSPTGELLIVLDGAEAHTADVFGLIDLNTGTPRWTAHPNGPLELKVTRVTSAAFSADGQNLAVGGHDGTLVLYETATGRRRHAFAGHRRAVDGLAFTPDGALLAASSADAPVFLWDVYGIHDRERKLSPWSTADAPDVWKELADADSERAFLAIRRLIHHPQPAVALLREYLQPRMAVLEKAFQKLLRDLESDEFQVRQQAYAELKHRADEFEFPLERSVTESQPLEVQRRLEPIIAKLDPLNPERLRRQRAMEALRQMAMPEAQRLLRSLRGAVSKP